MGMPGGFGLVVAVGFWAFLCIGFWLIEVEV